MEYTQEQLDALILEKVADAKKGLFTEEDLNKKVGSEVDRRVETGIQKGLETQKEKWEREFTERANLSAEELAKKKLEEEMGHIKSKETEINKRANMIDAKDMLSEAQIPKSHYDNFITMLVNDDAEVTKSNVSNFINMFNKTKEEIEIKLKSEGSKMKPPNTGGSDDAITKEKFNKMGYAEKLTLKQTNPELYNKFIR